MTSNGRRAKWTVEKLAADYDYIDVLWFYVSACSQIIGCLWCQCSAGRGCPRSAPRDIRSLCNGTTDQTPSKSGSRGRGAIWAARGRGSTAHAGDGWPDCSKDWPAITAGSVSIIPATPAKPKAGKADCILRLASCDYASAGLLH
jgi:hypothetical protein